MSQYTDDLYEQMIVSLQAVLAAVLTMGSTAGTNTWALRQTFTTGVKLGAVAYASLPAAPAEGLMMSVTDSNTATWGATVAAGGSNHILAYFNGTNWTVAGK